MNMPQASIYFSEEEDKKIDEISKEWSLSKQETVKRIIMEYKFKRKKK